MNMIATRGASMPSLQWWADPKMVALVKRTAARDCNQDEFDEFCAVARELQLSPLRKQIYAFVFSKSDPEKRNMVIVIGIDGMRAISARSGFYRPDNRAPRWTIDPHLVDPDTNPVGLVSCEVSIFLGHKLKGADNAEHIEWSEVVGVAYWDEFAPIKTVGEDEDSYEWVPTGETWPDSGKPKKRKQLREGATAKPMLDPKKDGWRKSGRHMLAKCAEAIAHRKANAEPLSRVYADEELDRARTIEVDYTDMTPSEMAEKGEADVRLARIGGPAILACDETGTLVRVEFGGFADWALAQTEKKPPAAVKEFTERNRVALQEFWAHNKTDALELKKQLEARSAGAPPTADPALGRKGPSAAVQANRGQLKAALIAEIDGLESMLGALQWQRDVRVRMNDGGLSRADITEVEKAFLAKQSKLTA